MQTNPTTTLPQHMSQADFLKVAKATRLVNHGRGWEVFLGDASLGFAEGTERDALIQAHSREVNNALFANDSDTGDFSCPLPTEMALAAYPELKALFPMAVARMAREKVQEEQRQLPLLDLMRTVLDRLAAGEPFNEVVEGTGVTARLCEARRAAMVAEDPWHLFYIEVVRGDDHTGDQTRQFLVSAQSGSQVKAEELARAAVEDSLAEGWLVEHSHKVCECDGDVWQALDEPFSPAADTEEARPAARGG